MTPQEALAAAEPLSPGLRRVAGVDPGSIIVRALAEAGYTIVRSDDLLEIARIAGADLSGIEHAGQLAYPPLIEYVTAEVRALRESYDECLKETP